MGNLPTYVISNSMKWTMSSSAYHGVPSDMLRLRTKRLASPSYLPGQTDPQQALVRVREETISMKACRPL